MTSSSSRLDFVVAVDFGMTFTGVAYSMSPDWPSPITLQQWPGKLGNEIANKVKTAISYDIPTGGSLAWGFLSEQMRHQAKNPQIRTEGHFKLYLDPDYIDINPNRPSLQEAQFWFFSFMNCLFLFIQKYFSERFPRWSHAKVEFVFSVPTTWKNAAVIAHIEDIIRNSGFGSYQNQTIHISLTEAEAAAVYSAKQHYDPDDVILVCDAGGGTTDINILKIASVGIRTAITPLCYVEGNATGSAMIDYRMAQIIVERLKPIVHHLQGSPQELADQMVRERFETFKCSFGAEALSMERLPLPIPGLELGQNFPQAKIENSRMIITRDELKQLFDEQLEKIFTLIDGQLDRLQATHSGEIVVESPHSYLVVSGGLGSSPYLRQRLRERYQLGAGNLYPNIQDLRILLAPEPQLAVCHGLVTNRIQEITSSSIVYTSRCCRVSYGVVCRKKYDPSRHAGENITVDQYDKKRWVDNQIHWVIKKGDPISVKHGIRYPYRLKRVLGAEHTPWRTQIVMSPLPPTRLPRSTTCDGVVRVCTLESTLEHADMQRKNNHWYNWSREYWLAEFEMWILIGAADLQFQLWSKRGQRLDRSGNSIAVEWEPPRRGVDADAILKEGYHGIYRA